ncbi:MAG: NAD-dependent epimerase/dehydratase family protein [Aquabacterium sp.]|uniref:NAD(P)H-binding protein n=1 Tax=Aquabacterium sp. TaxID=1872578 RepID=UPI0011F47FD0|nr:NAD(P)H-binding protein [Aquabacterium sp.]TAK99158.1 MAG: NAD-dependent epimerase/dehydratase family protein [Aquabacterium sp.]
MTSTSTPARVLLAGATGLVGQQALRQLLARADVAEVRALVRREMTPAELLGIEPEQLEGSGKLRICRVDFNRLEAHVHWFDVDWVFCALGTTIRQAGSQAAFRQVDFDYALQIAQLAKAEGARRFLLVSALGAKARSSVFYNRVKGELEEAIKAIGFEHVSVAQPSLLVGDRTEVRLGERIGLKFSFLVPARYKPVRVEQVAAGLIASGSLGKPGWYVLDNIILRSML